ncbi:MAG: ABC transporter ATP-binding protein [Planctomycetes bacterium]|nr:ABC transporter ATP-binding protein [Planctomycetota bacterium]
MTILETRDLTCAYDRQVVVDHVAFRARSGEVVTLLGPNGAGKTTLLRALARLLPPRSGHVLLDDRDIWSMAPRAVARLAALGPQNESRDWPLTVREAVRLGRVPHRGWLSPFNGEDQAIVDESIRRLDLGDLVDRPVTQLSGGEWRRVVLARAIAQQPRVLLLDEPTSQLDIKHQLDVLSHVRKLASDGLAVIVTLHDLNQAVACADRMVLVHGRRVVADGPPESVLTAERIADVYGIRARVLPHPVFGTPWVVPLID